MEDLGKVELNDKDLPAHKQAYKCSLFIHQDNATKGDLLWQSTSERHVSFYLSEDKKSKLPILLNIEIDSTPVGSLKAYTTDINIKE